MCGGFGTGLPVDHLVSVSVIDEDSALADAAATAITVAGPQAWVRVAKSMGVSQVLVMDKQGTLYVSPEMLARLQFETDKTFKIKTSEPLSQALALSHLRQSAESVAY